MIKTIILKQAAYQMNVQLLITACEANHTIIIMQNNNNDAELYHFIINIQ